MATMRANSRLQVGSTSWISEERNSALKIAEAESEEFTFSARNDLEWLNEHMAEIFSENQVNVAEIFKTPGKLRGKTPRTARKKDALGARIPLSDVFSATPKGVPSPFRHPIQDRPVATFKVAEDEPQSVERVAPVTAVEDPFIQKAAPTVFDSGYFGSQQATQLIEATQPNDSIHIETPSTSPARVSPQVEEPVEEPEEEIVQDVQDKDVIMEDSPSSEERRSTEGSFQSAKEEQTKQVILDVSDEPEPQPAERSPLQESQHPILESPLQSRTKPPSPQKRSPERSPTKSPAKTLQLPENIQSMEEEHMEDTHSASDGSSPIRPIVRKSSLNFASLPAREPITTKKSIGARVSRTSHVEQSRTSYYGRQTGGKSLGNARPEEQDHDDDDMDMDEPVGSEEKDLMSRLHNKTSTQRLQDQISMLGKSQSTTRPTGKSIANNAGLLSQPIQSVQAPAPVAKDTVSQSPQRKTFVAPGAFPDDEEDSWIGPPNTAAAAPSIFSPRPQMPKSKSTDVMEGIRGKDSIGGEQFNLPKRGESPLPRSPLREPTIPERTTSTLGHIKSVSTSVLRSPRKAGESAEKKPISVSNPNPSLGTDDGETTPSKSPSRSYRGSPLKAAKDKFSSILKSSRGLFASSAAVSAEAKTSTLSPIPNRMGLKSQTSLEQVLQGYTLPQEDFAASQQSQKVPDSPGKASVRKTRASTEREEKQREEAAREAKEAKEAQKMANQLEKARQKVKEEARVYHMEQERVAAMQKEVIARKEQEKLAKASQVDVPRATRTSPRKTKAQLEAEGIAAAASTSIDELSNKDVEMTDASSMPPPAGPRPKSQIGRPPAKRPMKPGKEPASKANPRTVIRVNTKSQDNHIGHQYHPSTSTLAATLKESLGAPPAASHGSLRKQPSTASMQSTSSRSNGFKSAAAKTLEAAARKKEIEEQKEQRKKEAKQELERQRAAIREEEKRKEEQQRRLEVEQQQAARREKEQAAAAAEAKKNAARQAMERKRLEMEKAKLAGAPPPALRPQPSGDLTMSMLNDKPLPSVPSQRSDLAQSINRMNGASRPQGDTVRPTTASMHTAAKIPPKRPLQQDNGDDYHARPPIQRNVSSYQQNDKDSKRRKTNDVFDDEDFMSPSPAKLTAPPIRQSSIRPKEMQSKSGFPFHNGYSNVPQQNNLQKSTLMSQHSMNQAKTAHPMDMAQVSKAPIPFASSSSQGNAQYKTPARPGATQHGGKSGKSAKSSPQYVNGEYIDLPEIESDDEDDIDMRPKAVAERAARKAARAAAYAKAFPPRPWLESPALRSQLAIQEGLNPSDVFGPTAPLVMEEVFNKSKERFGNFRKRTSSANWSGPDRLTNEEIQRDLEARDRIRRQGGWTHNSLV